MTHSGYKTIAKSEVFSHPWLNIDWREVIDTSGVQSEQLVLERPDFLAALLLYSVQSSVVLVRRYRYAPDEFCWELPQQRLDAGDLVWANVARWLATRYCRSDAIGGPIHLGSFYEASGYSSHRCHCVLVEVKGEPDPAMLRDPDIRLLNPWDPSQLASISSTSDAATLSCFLELIAYKPNLKIDS
jgi:hypothetical protein